MEEEFDPRTTFRQLFYSLRVLITTDTDDLTQEQQLVRMQSLLEACRGVAAVGTEIPLEECILAEEYMWEYPDDENEEPQDEKS